MQCPQTSHYKSELFEQIAKRSNANILQLCNQNIFLKNYHPSMLSFSI